MSAHAGKSGAGAGSRPAAHAAADREDALVPGTDLPDLYRRLGVKSDARTEEIRAAFRALARKLHPDVNAAPGATVSFAKVQQAYETLSDAEKRRAYDLAVQSALTPASDGRAHYSWTNIADPRSNVGSIDDELFEELYTAFFEPRFDDEHRGHTEAPGKAGKTSPAAPKPRTQKRAPRSPSPKGRDKRG